MGRMTITEWVHRQLQEYVQKAECCVDATAGKGKDTLFLCENMPPQGKVFAFDIQKEALDLAEELLQKNGHTVRIYHRTNDEQDCRARLILEDEQDCKARLILEDEQDCKVQLILDGHEHMEHYILPERVDVIMFNLGYLPGGDHALATQSATTIAAIEQGLSLLKCGGVMSICIYSGGDSGFVERDAVLAYLEALDARQYTVIVSNFYNKPNHPPIPVLIRREF